MSRQSSILFVLFLFIAASVPCLSQIRGRIDASTEGIWSEKPLVTGTATTDQVRLTALALTQRIRLEVLSQAGEPLYDSGFRPGNRLEWEVRDQHGSEMRDGVYGCIVTVEDLNGQISHKRGILEVREGTVTFATLKRQAVASDEQENLTILSAEDSSPFTFVSHDGKEGWIESARGGLSFYAGSLSRNQDAVPHLRLTPEGNLGIGVAEPTARLDVAGLIRASEGFQFSDGTILKMEDGLPVLVSERLDGNGGSPAGAGKVSWPPATGSSVRMAYASGGSPGRVLSNEIGSNTWFGEGAGSSIMVGINNSFFGQNAGNKTNGTTPSNGSYNSFFGAAAGYSNTTGGRNSFFGEGAGYFNTTSTENAFFGFRAGYSTDVNGGNSFFGNMAGYSNTTGNSNNFFGNLAGYSNTTGSLNMFFGDLAGYSNTTGSENLFFGNRAGYLNTTGYHNSFFGPYAGYLNTTGNHNSFFGNEAGNSNTEGYGNGFFGNLAGYSNTTGNFNSFFGSAAGLYNTTGYDNSFFGHEAGSFNSEGYLNAFFGSEAGFVNTTGNNNSFFGNHAGYTNYTGSNDTYIGAFSGGEDGITNATAIGFGARVTQSNSLVLGNAFTSVGIGVTAPQHRLHVESSFPNPAAGGRATYSYTYFTPASNHSGYIFGLESAARYTGQYNLTATHTAPGYALAALSGYYGGTVAEGSGGMGSVETVTGVTAQNIMRNSITVNHAIGVEVQPAIADVGSATVSNVYGMYVKNPYNVAPTNVYGLYTESLTTGTNNYGVYVSGNSKSFFGGNVGIGTSAPTEKLHVIGNLRVSGSILYGAGEEPVPDYVFEPDYRLMPTEELARYLKKEKHLPNVPSAAEMKEKGLNLSEFQMKLLEKIEELTLYTVQQAKTIREQQTAASRKDAEIASLNDRLAALERMMQRLARQEERK